MNRQKIEYLHDLMIFAILMNGPGISYIGNEKKKKKKKKKKRPHEIEKAKL